MARVAKRSGMGPTGSKKISSASTSVPTKGKGPFEGSMKRMPESRTKKAR